MRGDHRRQWRRQIDADALDNRRDPQRARDGAAPGPADRRKAPGPWNLASVYDLFPILRERRNSSGVALSGGQQQMVAIGRALMSNPELLLCDEISLGLAPVVIRDIYAALPKVRYAGAAIVVVEQDIGKALAVADRVYCMMEGRVTLVAKASEVTRQEIHAAYFGEAA
jgi:branched-chain amino acid transport system ATP-binding protein